MNGPLFEIFSGSDPFSALVSRSTLVDFRPWKPFEKPPSRTRFVGRKLLSPLHFRNPNGFVPRVGPSREHAFSIQ